MAYLRQRALVSGELRYDVDYRDAGRKRRRTFTNPDQAQAFRARAEQADQHPVPRWPLAPLLAAVGMPAKRFARHFRIPSSNVYRAAQHGLSDRQADHWAVAAGLHPMTVWGWAWIDAAPTSVSDLQDQAPQPGEAVA